MIEDIFRIETKNLFLVPLPNNYIKKCLNGRRTMEEALNLFPVGISIENETSSTIEALKNMISLVEKNIGFEKWFTNWEFVLKEKNRIIGGGAFYGSPCKENGYCPEIAYIIQEEFRNLGYGSEAVKAMTNWALENGAEEVMALIEDFNISSQKLIVKCGFRLDNIENGVITYKIRKKCR